jgi:hypothetical protein
VLEQARGARQSKAIQTVTVSSWAQLIDELYRDSWDRGLDRFRSPFVFRGVCDAASELTTSLMRLGDGREDLSRIERHLLRNFRKYAHAEGGAGPSIWNWLALAQHHGLQTRLLDWTFSPFVAMHFATDDPAKFDRDGAIWCVNHIRTNQLLPDPLKREADREGSCVFTVEMLNDVAPALEDFDNLARDLFVVFMEPPSLDARIVNQYALFSVMSSPSANMCDFLEQHAGVARRILIPASLKWEVRDKLDQANINERMLFPGLDGLTRWLSRYYKSR